MALAAVFVVRQRDFKRMLAYSSVEHMGILVLGIGLGGIGVFGALLHAINNGLTKGVLFLSAGNIHRAYGSKNIDEVSGAISRLPISGSLFLVGFFAITGSPPFGPFVSEFTIVNAAIGGGHPVAGTLFLVLLGIVFIGMGSTVLSVVQGRPGTASAGTPYRDDMTRTLPILVAAGLVLLLGLYLPAPLVSLLERPPRAWRRCREGGRLHPHAQRRGAPPRARPSLRLRRLPRRPPRRARRRTPARRLLRGAGSRAAAAALCAVLADDGPGALGVARTLLPDDRFPSLTPAAPQAHLFEREIAEQFGLKPQGHPWLKPVRYRPSWRPGHDAWGRKEGEAILPAVGDFFRVEGDEVHEVAVGPVHAGVIEPGHFRFQCHGEQVFHLEIALGYQHRGVEESLLGGPHRHTAARMETLAGDTTIGHATAYAQAVEALSGTHVPPRAQAIRGIALELERLANHTGDLGALAGDVGFLPTASFCGRLRGDFLNMTAAPLRQPLRPRPRPPGRDARRPRRRARGRAPPPARGDDEGPARRGRAPLRSGDRHGALRGDGARRVRDAPSRSASSARRRGPAASTRTCGATTRPGIYRFTHVPVMTAHDGDVNARAFVRWLEAQRSADFVKAQLAALPKGGVRARREADPARARRSSPSSRGGAARSATSR